MSFLYKEKNLSPYTHFSYSEKVEKVGIVWQSATKILDTHKQCHKLKKSLEAKLFPNAERCLWATRLCPKSERLRKKVSKHVTSLRSRVHFVLPQHPPAKRQTQTGLSESQTTRAETCFAAGRRERSGRGPARLSPTLKPRGPSGLCELCAGACWGRTWYGRPGRRWRRWISSRGPFWVWIPPGTPVPPRRPRCRLVKASRARGHRACAGI